MKSKTTSDFWKCYKALPNEIREQAKKVYKLFNENPYHPSLHFKRIHSSRPIFSVRITVNYRAVGIITNEVIIWFWIGSHSDYDKLVKNVRKNM